jgi:hypothetical protein
MAKLPDRINIDKSDREIYNSLDQEEILKFKGGRRTRREQFIFSLAVGFNNKIKSESEIENKEGWFNARELQSEDYAILNAVALFHTGTTDILTKKDLVFKIAEVYAHIGIRLLSNKIKNTPYGSFDKILEKDLDDLFSKIKMK